MNIKKIKYWTISKKLHLMLNYNLPKKHEQKLSEQRIEFWKFKWCPIHRKLQWRKWRVTRIIKIRNILAPSFHYLGRGQSRLKLISEIANNNQQARLRMASKIAVFMASRVTMIIMHYGSLFKNHEILKKIWKFDL